MPTVEFFVNGQWQPVDVGEGATQKDLDEIAGQLGGSRSAEPPPTPETKPAEEPSTWYGRAAEYVSGRAKDYAQALADVSGYGEELGTQGPGAPMPVVPPKRAALDVATLGATGLNLPVAGAGIIAGAGVRALGLPAEAAQGAEFATDVMGGGVQSARAGLRAVGTAATAPAAQAARAVEEFQGLGTSTPIEAGIAVRPAIPSAAAAERAAFQDATYKRIGQWAMNAGRNASYDNPVGQDLVNRLRAADDEWGMLASSAERKQVNALVSRLQAPAPTGLVDAAGNPIPSTAPQPPVTWDELDKADKALQRVKGPSSVRAAISDAKKALLQDTWAEKALNDANDQWKLTIRPALDLANKVTRAESPAQAFYQVAGSAKDPQRLATAQRLLEAHAPDVWPKVVGGFFTDIAERARGDPQKIVKLWEGVRPGIKAVVDPDGIADRAIADMTSATGPAIPTPLRRYGELAFRGAGGVGGVLGGYNAFRRFYHGDWAGGLQDLGLTALLTTPTLGTAFVAGAAPTAARVATLPASRFAQQFSQPVEQPQP